MLEALLSWGEDLLEALLALREATWHASSLCPWVLLLSSKLGLLLALRGHARLCSVLLLSGKVMGPISGLLRALSGILGVALGRQLLLLGIRCALRREGLAATGVWVTWVVALLRVPTDNPRLVKTRCHAGTKLFQQLHSVEGGELTTAWWPLAANEDVFVGGLGLSLIAFSENS